METKNQNNTGSNTPKNLEDIFKEKFDAHRLPVDAGLWTDIQSQMKRKKLAPIWWLSVAAVLALIFFVLPWQYDAKDNMAAHNSPIESQQKASSAQDESTKISDIEKAEISAPQAISAQNQGSKPAIPVKTDLAVNNSTFDSTEHKAIDVDNGMEAQPMNAECEIAQTSPKKEEPEKANQNLIWEDPLKTKNDNTWAVIAALSTSQGRSGNPQFASNANSAVNASLFRAPGIQTAATIFSPSDFSSQKFYAPISFGLRIAKNIAPRIRIGTGLIYSYLQTDFIDTNRSAQLSLHYAGIPLNINYKIWEQNKWSAYASAGATVEKGLRSVYTQTQHIGNPILSTDANTKIDGLQWSVNTAVNLNYSFSKNYDLYLEPSFAYYFDNDQPYSIRCEKKFSPNIEAGLRFNF